MDKWNRKQLKSLEITGNRFAREKFVELGIPKISGIPDYTCDAIQKYKSQLAEVVKNLLLNEQGSMINNNNTGLEKVESVETKPSSGIKSIEEVNFDDVPVKENEFKEATKFKINEATNIKVIDTGVKGGKGNKIKKVDFDFNFESFNDVNFSEFDADKNEKSQKVPETISPVEREEEEEIDRSYKPKISKEEINKKFANKKAISSEDYEKLEENPYENSSYKNKLNSMKYSQAIGSCDLYGEKYEDGKTEP